MGNELAIMDEGGEMIEVNRPAGAIESITRAEIDRQVATALRFPRSVSAFLKEAESLVSIDHRIAEQCTFVLLGKKGKDGKDVSGPSVRLAEILFGCWRNISVGVRVIGDDGRFVTAQGVAIDHEKNTRISIEVMRQVVDRHGRRLSDDNVRSISQAALSIAKRNAIFEVIPRVYVGAVQDKAKEAARATSQTLPDRTKKALGWFSERGIPNSKVFALLNIGGEADISIDMLEQLRGLCVAINEGDITFDELFAKQAESEAPTKSQTLTDKIKGQTAKADAPKPESPKQENPGTKVERPSPADAPKPQKVDLAAPVIAQPKPPEAGPVAVSPALAEVLDSKVEVAVIGFSGDGPDRRPYAQAVTEAIKATTAGMQDEWTEVAGSEKYPQSLLMYASRIHSMLWSRAFKAKLPGFVEPEPLSADVIRLASPLYDADSAWFRSQINEIMDEKVQDMRSRLKKLRPANEDAEAPYQDPQ